MRCTKQTDRRRAETAADEIEKATLAENGAGDECSKKMLAVLKLAVEQGSRGLLTEAVCRNYLEEIFEAANGEKLTTFSNRSWFDEWLARKEKTCKQATLYLYSGSCKSLCAFLGSKAETRIEQVRPAEIRRWRDGLNSEGRAGKTCNQYLKAIRAAYSAAVAEGIILKSPADGIDFLPQDDSVKREPFEVREVTALIASAPAEWQLAIKLGFYTGLRLRDIANLRWDHVDFERSVISIEPMKQPRKRTVKKRIFIPIHDDLETAFANHPIVSRDSAAPVFPDLAGLPAGGPTGLSYIFSGIMDKARVDPMLKKTPAKGKAGRSVTARGFHSLRHTFVSQLANNEVAPELRQEIAGHSDSQTHAIYTHLDAERLRGAVSKLPNV